MTIQPALSFADYLAHPAYGSSDLKSFRCGPPAMVPWRRTHRNDSTPSTRLGTAAHCMLLTPVLFLAQYAMRPDDERGDFRTKAGKQWRDDVAAAGMEALTADEFATICAVAEAVKAKLPNGATISDAAQVECSVFWTCDNSGLPCKGRPDWFTADAVYDLKVSIVADKPVDAMAWAISGNGWFHQLGHNRAGLHANGMPRVKVGRLVIVSPNAPHNVHLIEVRESDMDFLELSNENTRRAMAVCHRSGKWPGTPDSWQQIELPASTAYTEQDIESAEEMPV